MLWKIQTFKIFNAIKSSSEIYFKITEVDNDKNTLIFANGNR